MTDAVSTEGRKGVFLPLTPIAAQDACEKLGVTPQVLRGLCDEYADFINLHRRDGRTYLDALSFSRLRLVVYWRGRGLAADEIRGRLSEAQGETEEARSAADLDGEGAEAPAGEDPGGLLAQIQRRLDEQERRWREDKDRLLTLCMRLQQEVSHLRGKVDQLSSRRFRRRLL